MLGVDNGIGVVVIMVVLEVDDLKYLFIEVFFIIDEEIGMIGVKGFDVSMLEGSILFNLDFEEDDELIIGCVGGIDSNI